MAADDTAGYVDVTHTPATFGAAREEFLAMVEGVRPELHRYAARLTGSVIAGEDIVQETLARAFYALSQTPEVPALRPWLFRIAHNAAMDLLKTHAHRLTEARDDLEPVAGFDERPDPAVVRAALSRFLALPVIQRSAVILKDVLGHSLEETATTMSTTVPAVKAALVRGRSSLRDEGSREATIDGDARAVLDRYAHLFNARDWDGVRALVSDDCHLDLVSRSQRRGREVGLYFTNYERAQVALRVAILDDAPVLAAFVDGAVQASYVILLEVVNDRVTRIRDFRYVPYIVDEVELRFP